MERNREKKGWPLTCGGQRQGKDSCKEEGSAAKTSTKTWVIIVHETHVPIPGEVQGPGQEHKNSFLATFFQISVKDNGPIGGPQIAYTEGHRAQFLYL